MDFPFRKPLRLLLLAIGLGISACVLKEPIPAIPPIDPSFLQVSTPLSKRLQAHVGYLASPVLKGRKPGTPGNQRAAEYIIGKFKVAGLVPFNSLGSFQQSIDKTIGDNLIGLRYGRSKSAQKRFILIGAHFDHLGEIEGEIYPGADDNAAAIAVLLELAFATQPLKNYSVVFVGFNAEEPPYFQTSQMGSQHFLKHLPTEIGKPQHIQVAIIMDLMGGVHWRPLQNVVFSAGAEASPALYQQVKKVLRIHQNEHGLEIKPIGLHMIEEIPVIGNRAFSDYDAFRNASVPILFLSAGRTPRYHQPTDTPNTLHYERMALSMQWLHSLIARIDGYRKPYTYQPNQIAFEDEIASFRPLIAQAANWKTRIPGSSASSVEKFQSDLQWLSNLNPSNPGEDDIKQIERASIRLQCLLAQMSLCHLF